jgi:hypothetical protein
MIISFQKTRCLIFEKKERFESLRYLLVYDQFVFKFELGCLFDKISKTDLM